jgi:hypothetical protein
MILAANGAVKVSFTAPDDNESAITAYKIEISYFVLDPGTGTMITQWAEELSSCDASTT